MFTSDPSSLARYIDLRPQTREGGGGKVCVDLFFVRPVRVIV